MKAMKALIAVSVNLTPGTQSPVLLKDPEIPLPNTRGGQLQMAPWFRVEGLFLIRRIRVSGPEARTVYGKDSTLSPI